MVNQVTDDSSQWLSCPLHVQVKMVTADDDSVTDILVEGPEEEVMRLRKEFNLMEKGKELVKGLLEQ